MDPLLIAWEGDETHLFVNPKLPISENVVMPAMPGHIWLATSGTTGQKYVALSKKAFLISAAEVNSYLEASSEDHWLAALPHFHVGGLSIYARAYLARAKVYKLASWDPAAFVDAAKKVSFASVVPSQLFDLVKQKKKAPGNFKRLIVGGAALCDELRKRGEALNWPITHTYGMTECASQIAVEGTLLPHIQAKTDEQARLWIKSDSLLSGYLKGGDFVDPKISGWFQTGDLACLTDGKLILLGRQEEMVKILGEKVYLLPLKQRLQEICVTENLSIKFRLYPVADDRNGCSLHLDAAGPQKQIQRLVAAYQNSVLPFERIANFQCIPKQLISCSEFQK